MFAFAALTTIHKQQLMMQSATVTTDANNFVEFAQFTRFTDEFLLISSLEGPDFVGMYPWNSEITTHSCNYTRFIEERTKCVLSRLQAQRY